MSSSDTPGPKVPLKLSSPSGAVEMRVYDAAFNTAVRGFGHIDCMLPAGLYQLEFRAGASVAQKIIALRPGAGYEDQAIELPFPTPVPIKGTSTFVDGHLLAVQRLAARPGVDLGGDGGVVVMVRNLPSERRSETLSLGPAALPGLVDSQWNAVDGWSERAQIDEYAGWGGASARLPAGGYALRFSARRTSVGAISVDQSIVVSPGWQTLVFIPNASGGADPGRSSIHYAPLDVSAWDLSDNAHRMLRVSEVTLAGLRAGRVLVPVDQLRELVDAGPLDPMMGFIGLHGMCSRDHPDLELSREVLQHLDRAVPNHPDLGALAVMTGAVDYGARIPPCAWPPMFAAAYRAMLTQDARDVNAIEDDSPAEAVAPSLLACDLWTTWRSMSATPLPLGVVPRQAKQSSLHWLTDIGQKTADEAVARVATYLARATRHDTSEDLSSLLRSVDVPHVSLNTGLPTRSVQRALTQLERGATADD
jgi:hypothetical protein